MAQEHEADEMVQWCLTIMILGTYEQEQTESNLQLTWQYVPKNVCFGY